MGQLQNPMRALPQETLPDLFDPALARNPYPAYAALRRGPDVVHDTRQDWWIVHRYSDVRSILRDPANFSSANASMEHTLLGADGETHERVRRALASSFSAAGVRQLRGAIVGAVAQRLDALAARGTADIIADLAIPLPQTIIGQLVGLPALATAKLPAWSQALVGTGDASDLATRGRIVRDCRNFLREHLSSFKADGLAVAGLEKGRSGLTFRQRIDLGLLLVAAGVVTTTNLIGSAVHILLGDPGLARTLRAEPDLVGPFIEEVLRHRSPVQRLRRVVVKETKVAGRSVPAGANVLVLIGAANLDPLKFQEADSFLPFRQPNQHLSLGIGAHTCLGLWLTRMEATLAIQALLQRFARIDAVSPLDETEYLRALEVFGPARLDIAVHP